MIWIRRKEAAAGLGIRDRKRWGVESGVWSVKKAVFPFLCSPPPTPHSPLSTFFMAIGNDIIYAT
jgi:hypothetical protein